MPEEKNGSDVDNTQEPDAFGITLNPDGTEVPQSKTEEKKEEKKVGDENDISKNPIVVELQTKIKEYGNNLSNMRQSYEGKITDLNKQLADALQGKTKKDGGEEGGNTLFKEIKYSKDLSEEEREDMTDTEIRLFDENAKNQEVMNKMFETISNLNKSQEEKKVSDLNMSAQTEATSLAEEAIKTNPDLAKDATELKEKILVEFNEFNNDNITPDVLKTRMAKALNNVNGYKPPKEKETIIGGGNKPVKKGSGGGETSKVDEIVDSLDNNNNGDYEL